MKSLTKFFIRQNDKNFVISNIIYKWDLSYDGSLVRMILVLIFFILCFLGLSYRLIDITKQSKNESYYAKGGGKYRREIIDRNGHILAISLASSSLFANTTKILDIHDTANKLATIIPNIKRKSLLSSLASGKSFVWLKHDITPELQHLISELGLPGIGFEKEQKRIYPLGNLFSHVIGYVGRDAQGLAGLEKKYDEFLTAQDNSQSDKLVLSIDARLQRILSEELDMTISKFNAKGGVAIVANAKNGEILGLVSKPDFDPNDYHLSTAEQLFNQATQGVYELGSVFKTITLAVGLDSKSITLHDAYDISHLKIGKFNISDYHPMPGWHSVGEIFLHSSNIGVSKIMLDIGEENLKRYLQNLGLFEKTKIELPEVATPLTPGKGHWSDISLATMSFGYALSVSPLHFVQAMIPTVNGGYFYPVTLIKDGNKKIDNPQKVFFESTSQDIRKLMRLVVAQGTGKKAEVKGYFVGGKTGTAHKSKNGGYAKNSRMSSFCGIMPAHDPKYLIYVVIDEPKGISETYGFATAGWTAAPTVGNILAKIISLYNIEDHDENDPIINEILKMDYKIDKSI